MVNISQQIYKLEKDTGMLFDSQFLFLKTVFLQLYSLVERISSYFLYLYFTT